VTNFFFETPRLDPDTTDADCNVLEKDLRKMRVSNENRKQPIVQLGLFLDDDGIPISFGMFPGNTLDHHTLRPFYERELHVNASFLSFVEKLKANPGGFRIMAAQSQSLRRFLKKDVLDRRTGNVLDGTKLAAMIDDEKLSAFNALFGYYQIVTSEFDMPDREVIDKYHGFMQIEDQFREMKSTLETRPVYVRTREHIEAHLTVCFIALTMMRLIQRKMKSVFGPEFGKDLNWTYGIPGARLASALREWQVTELPGDYYQIHSVDVRIIA